jgi:hypothetical protein
MTATTNNLNEACETLFTRNPLAVDHGDREGIPYWAPHMLLSRDGDGPEFFMLTDLTPDDVKYGLPRFTMFRWYPGIGVAGDPLIGNALAGVLADAVPVALEDRP